MKPGFRLALRVEGDKWVAYLAKPDTMEGAVWMGSILLRIAEGNDYRKDLFIELMRHALNEAIEKQGIKVESWDTEDAPQHERAGRA